MSCSIKEPPLDAAAILASLSPQARNTIEQAVVVDVEALACEALARGVYLGEQSGPSGRISESELADAFLDRSRPLVSTFGMTRVAAGLAAPTGRVPTGVSLPAKVSREVGEVYVLHRICADMRACQAVRQRLLEGPRLGSLYVALMIASRDVNVIRWEMRCITVKQPPAGGRPPRSKWFGRALAVVPAPHYSIPPEAAQLGVDLLLEFDRRQYGELSDRRRVRLRSLLIDIALQWEMVKPLLGETCRHFYTGRYQFGLEADDRLGESLKRLGALHRKAERAMGKDGLRSFIDGFDSVVAAAGARLHPMTVAYDWIAGLD